MEWISVKDRLPEIEDCGILVYWPSNGAIETVQCQDYFADITNGRDEYGNQLYTKWFINQDVTHWMPLPDPPEGGK